MVRVRLIQALPQRQRPWRERGASLIELVIASVVLLLVAAGVVPLYSRATQDYRTARSSLDQQNSLDADFAEIRRLGERFSWCSGSGSTTVNVNSVSPSGPCTDATVGSSNYYIPKRSDASGIRTSQFASFETACNGATSASDPLTTALVTAINAIAAPAGLSRTVSLDDGLAHRLRIQYRQTSDNSLVSTLIYTPPVAIWCP